MPHPIHLIAGGPGHRRRGPDPLLQGALALAGRRLPSIAYVGVASEDDAGFFRWIAAMFGAAGAGPVRLARMAARDADLDEARRVIEAADLVYITGGDVEAGMEHLRRCRMAPVLKRLYRAGKPFFGLSAGSIMLAREWIRWEDPADNSTAAPFACLDLAPVLCDCHAEEDDWEELHALLRLKPEGTLGYGIPSGGAIEVSQAGVVRASGRPAVVYEHCGGVIRRRPDLQPHL